MQDAECSTEMNHCDCFFFCAFHICFFSELKMNISFLHSLSPSFFPQILSRRKFSQRSAFSINHLKCTVQQILFFFLFPPPTNDILLYREAIVADESSLTRMKQREIFIMCVVLKFPLNSSRPLDIGRLYTNFLRWGCSKRRKKMNTPDASYSHITACCPHLLYARMVICTHVSSFVFASL